MNLDNYKMYVTTGRGMGKTWFNDAWKKAVLGEDGSIKDTVGYWCKDLIDTVAIEENLKKEKGEESMLYERTVLDTIMSIAIERGLRCVIEDNLELDYVRLRFTTSDGITIQHSLSKTDLVMPEYKYCEFSRCIMAQVLHQISKESEKKDKERLETAMKNTCKVEYHSYSRNRAVQIKNVIFNPPATIVFWTDNTKTVVKAVNEAFDPEKGLAMAIAKKHFGNEGNYFNQIKKWTETFVDPRSTFLNKKFNIAEKIAEASKKANEGMKALVETIEKHTSGDD